MELSDELAGEIQQSWHRFLQRTESLRPVLHRYCRSLTGSVWDAEDLVQDTLLRGFAKLGEFSNPIDNPKAYLFRIATNLWVDRVRLVEIPAPVVDLQTSNPEQAQEVRDAAKQFRKHEIAVLRFLDVIISGRTENIRAIQGRHRLLLLCTNHEDGIVEAAHDPLRTEQDR